MAKTSLLRTSFVLLVLAVASVAAQVNIRLDVDASEAFRNIVHVKETLEVRGGDIDLFYPKWIPGEHSPTGTINDMAYFALTYDHRIVDGADAEKFLAYLKNYLETTEFEY